jgi:hypothetical protein
MNLRDSKKIQSAMENPRRYVSDSTVAIDPEEEICKYEKWAMRRLMRCDPK